MPVFMVTLHHSLYLCVLSVFGMQELAFCKNCPLSLFLVQYIYLYTQKQGKYSKSQGKSSTIASKITKSASLLGGNSEARLCKSRV